MTSELALNSQSQGGQSSALEPELARLQRREAEGHEVPLSLRRFRAHLRTATTIEAMYAATSDLLAMYRLGGGDHSRVSAKRLSQLCQLALEGEPGRSRAAGAVYASQRLGDGWRGHTGALRMDSRPFTILLPRGLDWLRARIAVAHEIGHYLIHRRGDNVDEFTSRLPTSEYEEALAELAARLLLLPNAYRTLATTTTNFAVACIDAARAADVTLHASAARLGDPDIDCSGQIRAVVLWRMKPEASPDEALHLRFTPQWHICTDAFIPVKRCHASRASLVAELASQRERQASGSRMERVKIGTLRGSYRVDALSWGSVSRGTRLVLSIFVNA